MRLVFAILAILSLSCNQRKPDNEEFYLNIDEHQIHVKSTGKGVPIVFIHGGYLDLEMWDAQVEAFTDSHHIIRFSDLGHGKTIRSQHETLGYEIINTLTARLSDNKLVLVGHSWGAMLCVDFALNYPEKVDKLVLVSPGLSGWPYFQDSVAAYNNRLRQKAIADLDTLQSAKLFHKNWVVGPRRQEDELDESFYNNSLNMIARNMANHWQEHWSPLDSPEARKRLEEVKAPTYIIVGENDAQDIRSISDEYNSRIEKSKKIEVNNVAHMLNMENPKEFNKILLRILKE